MHTLSKFSLEGINYLKIKIGGLYNRHKHGLHLSNYEQLAEPVSDSKETCSMNICTTATTRNNENVSFLLIFRYTYIIYTYFKYIKHVHSSENYRRAKYKKKFTRNMLDKQPRNEQAGAKGHYPKGK